MRVVAVNVALMADGKFLAAAVADPFNDEMFFTDGVSAFAQVDGQDTPLAPSGSSKQVEELLATKRLQQSLGVL